MKRVKFFAFLLPVIAFFWLLPHTALAETKTLKVTKDTYANKAYPANVSGAFGSVTISNKFTDRLAYLQFENPDLPAGAIVDQATLKIYLFERLYADKAKLNVGPITGDWEEVDKPDNPGLTWNNKPTINQTQAIEAEIPLTADGWQEINLTDLTRRWQDGTIQNKGVFIYPYGFLYGAAETEYALSFKTKESGDQASKIEIEYHFAPTPSPEPTKTPTTKPSPLISPTGESTASPIPEEPSPEPSPETTLESTKEPGLILSLTTGQTIIVGLIFLALLGAVISFAAYFRRQPTEKHKKTEKPEKEEETPQDEEIA